MSKQIVLTVNSIDASRKAVEAGTVIAPDVEGWPAHRVARHLRDGMAKEVDAELEEEGGDDEGASEESVETLDGKSNLVAGQVAEVAGKLKKQKKK